MLDSFFIQPAISGEGDVLFLHRGINPNFSYFLLDHIFTKQIDALFKNLLHSFCSDPVTEVKKITWVKRQPVLEIDFTAKMLPVGILKIPLYYCFITQVVDLL